MPTTVRPFVLVGGLCGAAGVVLSAVSAHAGGPGLATAAQFLLVHAPAFLALGQLGHTTLGRTGGGVLLLGLLLFAGDLLARDVLGGSLFSFAAPTGGVLMIAGWLGLALLAFGPTRRY